MERTLIKLLHEKKWEDVKSFLQSKKYVTPSSVLRNALKENGRGVPLDIVTTLLSSTKLKNLRNVFEFACAEENQIGKEVKELLLEEMDPSPSMAGTLLLVAMKHGDKEAANIIVEKIPLFLAPGFHCNTFHDDGMLKELFELLMTHPLVSKDLIFHSQALHAAACRGNKHFANFILNKYAGTLTIKDRDGNIPLHCACQSGHLDVAGSLLSRGIETGQFKNGAVGGLLTLNKSQKSVLRLACGSGSDGARVSQVAEWLIDVDIDIFSNQDVLKEVQLVNLIARHGNLPIMNIILDKCPFPVQWKDQYGATPLSTAFDHERLDIALLVYRTAKRHKKINHFKLVKDAIPTALLNGEVDPDFIMQFISKAGIDPSHTRGTLLLFHIAGKGSRCHAALLVESCPSELAIRDACGCLPIHWACLHRNSDTVRYLITEACQIDEFRGAYGGLLATNNEGETPMQTLLIAFNGLDEDIQQVSDCISACMELFPGVPILHHAISAFGLDTENVMEEFIDMFHPNPCTRECGKTAMHFAIDACVRSIDVECNLSLLRLVMRYDRDYRKLLSVECSSGAQAVHYALSLDFGWNPYVQILAEGDFHSLAEPDDNTGLLPFMLAATTQKCDLNTIYELLRTDPSF